MNCPDCNGKTKVIDSRSVEEEVYRKRICLNCGKKFFTEETEADDKEGIRYYWAMAREFNRKKGEKNH